MTKVRDYLVACATKARAAFRFERVRDKARVAQSLSSTPAGCVEDTPGALVAAVALNNAVFNADAGYLNSQPVVEQPCDGPSDYGNADQSCSIGQSD